MWGRLAALSRDDIVTTLQLPERITAPQLFESYFRCEGPRGSRTWYRVDVEAHGQSPRILAAAATGDPPPPVLRVAWPR